MSLIGLLILVLIICIVIWATRALLGAFGVGEPISTVIFVIVIILCLVLLLQSLGGVSLSSLRIH